MRREIVLAVLLFASTSIHAQGQPRYVTLAVAEPEFAEGVPIFDSFTVDEDFELEGKRGVVNHGHLLTALGRCDPDWKCSGLTFFPFAVPARCDLLPDPSTWEYQGRRFKALNVLERSHGESSYAIEVRGPDGELVGAAMYSEKRGLESFGYFHGTDRVVFTQYYLDSEHGIARDGCLRVPD